MPHVHLFNFCNQWKAVCANVGRRLNLHKLPYMGKSKLRRQGQLQNTLQVPEEVLFTTFYLYRNIEI